MIPAWDNTPNGQGFAGSTSRGRRNGQGLSLISTPGQWGMAGWLGRLAKSNVRRSGRRVLEHILEQV